MLHKLFFMRNATFENVTALLIQEHDPLEFWKKHSHYTFCLSFQTSRIIWKNIWILKLPVSKHTFFCNIFPFLVHFTALVAYLFLKKYICIWFFKKVKVFYKKSSNHSNIYECLFSDEETKRYAFIVEDFLA